jgi:hypothetical protein
MVEEPKGRCGKVDADFPKAMRPDLIRGITLHQKERARWQMARHFGTELGRPKPPVFALEAATSVRISSLAVALRRGEARASFMMDCDRVGPPGVLGGEAVDGLGAQPQDAVSAFTGRVN